MLNVYIKITLPVTKIDLLITNKYALYTAIKPEINSVTLRAKLL